MPIVDEIEEPQSPEPQVLMVAELATRLAGMAEKHAEEAAQFLRQRKTRRAAMELARSDGFLQSSKLALVIARNL